jgi:hypothetical protein
MFYLKHEFESKTRQYEVLFKLKSLRLKHVISEKSVQEKEGLEFIYNAIVKLNTSCPTIYIGDAHEAIFLRDSVVGCSWAHDTLSRFGPKDMEFHSLYQQLAAALQLQADTDRAGHHESVALSTSFSQVTPTIFGQRYSNPAARVCGHGIVRSSRRSANRSNSRPKQPFDNKCWRCGTPGHITFQCTLRASSVRDAVRARVRNFGTVTVPWLKPFISWLWILILHRRWKTNCHPYL